MVDPRVDTVRVRANGMDVACLVAGDGPLVLCLHGFPDSATSWRPVLGALASAGYRAVAPFMRGYAPTGPSPDGCYQIADLALDANALHDAFGGGPAMVVGHDWGAPAAYGAAILAPERWRAVVGMAVPPWGAMGRALVGNLDQVQRSWYMFLFQHPLAEHLVSSGDFAFIDRLWSQWSPGFTAGSAVAAAKDAIRGDGCLAAALGYYRAALGGTHRDPARSDEQQRIDAGTPAQPLRYLHGANDGCIGTDVARDAAAHAPAGAEVRIVDGAGHFLQLERPDVVAAAVVEWADLHLR
jgi:pimeloyl-ACP methyl ester carboxylesterase